MAIQCTLEKSRTEEKYFARARKTGKVGMAEIAEEIQNDDSAVSVPIVALQSVPSYHCKRYRLYRCKRYQVF